MIIRQYPLKQCDVNASNYDMEGNLCLSEQQDILCTMPCVAEWISTYMSLLFLKWRTINLNYSSFKIFPQFWLAKSTRIIHLKQLLMTKFGRILCLTRKSRQKCSLPQVNAPLTEKTGGRGWVVFVVKTKMADTSLVSRVRTTAGTRRNNGKKRGKNNKKTTRRATSAIWRKFAELDKPKRALSKMNLTSMEVSMF